MADITIKDLAAGTPSLTDLTIMANPTTGVAKKITFTQLNNTLTLAGLSDVATGTPPANSILEWDGSFNYITSVIRASGLNVNRIPFLSASSPYELTSGRLYEGDYGIEVLDDVAPQNLPSAILNLVSTQKGFLKPRMTTAQRNSIASPAIGLEVYDTTLNLPYYYNGSAWATAISGITTLNTLTALTQTFAVGSAGTDFAISSATATHTFNIPTASATARGLLSSANWTTFNSKVGGSGTANYLAKFTASGTIGNSLIYDNGTSVGIGTTSLPSIYKLIVNGTFNLIGQTIIQDDGGGISFYDTAGVVPTGQISYNKYVGIYFYSQLAIPVKFGVNSAEVARYSTNGNLLINTTTDITSSKFTIASTSQGSIPLPRMTTAQIKAISSPVNGLMAYSTDEFTPCFYDSNAGRWEKISHSIL